MAEPREIRKIIKELNPNAVFVAGFDNALYGTGKAIGGHTVAVYIADECIRMLIEEHGMDEEEAWQHFNEIVVESNPGSHKPIFISDWRDANDIEYTIQAIKIEKQEALDEILDALEEEIEEIEGAMDEEDEMDEEDDWDFGHGQCDYE